MLTECVQGGLMSFLIHLLWVDDTLQLLNHILLHEDIARQRRCGCRQGSNRALPDSAFLSTE